MGTCSSMSKPSCHIMTISLSIPMDGAAMNDTVELLMSFCSLMDNWTKPNHVLHNMGEIMDFRFLHNNVQTDFIEKILHICSQYLEIILISRCMVSQVSLKLELCFMTYCVFVNIFYYRKPEMSA